MRTITGIFYHIIQITVLGLFICFSAKTSLALPAFAIREKASCTMCHQNGSVPMLTKVGYMYRRAGFRFSENIGNKEIDDKYMRLSEHLAAGVNLSYEYVSKTATAPGSSKIRRKIRRRKGLESGS